MLLLPAHSVRQVDCGILAAVVSACSWPARPSTLCIDRKGIHLWTHSKFLQAMLPSLQGFSHAVHPEVTPSSRGNACLFGTVSWSRCHLQYPAYRFIWLLETIDINRASSQ